MNPPTRDLLVVIDIDGTVADPTHRLHVLGDRKHRHHFDPSERDLLRAYMEPSLVANDTHVPGAQACVHRLHEHRRVKLAFITARDESLRDVTANWLLRFLYEDSPLADLAFAGNAELHMRALDDHRESHVVKAERAAGLLLHRRLRPWVWFDDDKNALDAAASLGFTPMAAPACWHDAVITTLLELCA